VFQATGESKAAARYNAAQSAVNVLGPTIKEEFERRKEEKQQREEARKAEREERLKQKAAEQEKKGEGEMGSVKMECGDTDQKPKAVTDSDAGVAGDQETKPYIKGVNALKVLKDIRPGVSCTGKVIQNAETGNHVAHVVVDGRTFEGRGDSDSTAKAAAAASALSSLFNLSFEYTPREFFCLII